METYLRAMKQHLPYRITQCYLSPDRLMYPALTPTRQAGTRFTGLP